MSKRLFRLQLLFVAFLSGCGSSQAKQESSPDSAIKLQDANTDVQNEQAVQTPQKVRTIRVETAKVVPSTASLFLSLPGEIEGRKDAMLASQLGGFVESVSVDVGSKVKKGQTLLKINTSMYAAQKAQAQAQLKQAKANFNRANKLKGSISDAEIEGMETQYKMAKAGLQLAKIQESRSVIRAPFSGVVAQLEVEEGEVAPPSAPILRLVQLEKVKVSLSVADRDVVALSPGMAVQVSTDALGREFEGEVDNIEPAANLQTRSFTVNVVVDNPDRLLLPGMIAKVRLETKLSGERIVLPQHVLVTRREGNGVFVIENGLAHWNPLKLGQVIRDQVIVDEGLKGGEEIAIKGHRELADGDAVLVARRGICCTEGRVDFKPEG